jgi:MFS family permease
MLTIQSESRSGEEKTAGDEQDFQDQQLATRYLYLSWAANSVSYLALSIIRYLLPKFIYQIAESGRALRMAPLTSGLMMLCQAGAQFIMFFVLGTTQRWRYKFTPLVVSQICASFGFLFIWLSNSPGLWGIGLIIIGLNVGMTYSSSIYYSLHGSTDPGGKSGWHESILHSGTIIGPTIGGALADYVGLKSPYLFCAAVTLMGLPVQLFILRRK